MHAYGGLWSQAPLLINRWHVGGMAVVVLQVGQEEYYDFIFPEEAGAAPHLKLLELAYKHKRQKQMAEEGDGL